MIDTHCHLTAPRLHEHVDAVIDRAREAGVDRMICIGTDPDDAANAVALAERHDGVYAAVGLQPHDAAHWLDTPDWIDRLNTLADHPKVVAIGEMGLEGHHPDPPMSIQQRAFAAQLAWAQQRDDMPIVIHNRLCTDTVTAMIREHNLPGERFVFHCFTGTADERDAIFKLGSMISITGIATFKSADDLARVSDGIPLDRLMVETDSPYLTPVPHRKIRPNEPRFVADVARFLAQRRDMTFDDFVAVVDANAARFFKLP